MSTHTQVVHRHACALSPQQRQRHHVNAVGTTVGVRARCEHHLSDEPVAHEVAAPEQVLPFVDEHRALGAVDSNSGEGGEDLVEEGV